MGFFGFVFWMVVLCFAFRALGRWQRRRWMLAQPRGYGQAGGWYDSSEFYAPRNTGIAPRRREKTGEQREYIDALESRVSELEERLDFTERLLTERQHREGSAPVQ